MLDQAITREEVSEFGIEELFFSRTDERGVIRSGNEVFFRVSKYATDDMIGAPHKLVRHPDMPKAIFWLMWDMIQQKKPVGAYVKNRASDGSYYWVFAMIVPVPDGYLSIRLKPTSELHAQIQQEYSALRSRELTEDLPAKESAEIFVARLEELGWPSYTSFMTGALLDETVARESQINGTSNRRIEDIAEMQKQANNSLEIAQNILNGFETIAGFPVNMHIQASKLKASGKIFGTIADNYERLSRRIENCMHAFIEARKTTSAQVDDGLFRLMLVQYAEETARLFDREMHEMSFATDESVQNSINYASETDMLKAQQRQNLENASTALMQISSEYKKFSRLIDDMLGILSGLSVTQFVGLVETARLNSSGETLNAMLHDVTSVQNAATENLKKMAGLNASIATRIKSLTSTL